MYELFKFLLLKQSNYLFAFTNNKKNDNEKKIINFIFIFVKIIKILKSSFILQYFVFVL